MSDTERECFKCGKGIDPRYSAYETWDETFKLYWKAGSDDHEHVRDKGAGKHPETQIREFCSYDCLTAFVQMDYEFPDHDEASANAEEGDR